MSDQPFTIAQNIFNAPHPPVLVTTYPLAGLTRGILKGFLATVDDGIVGVAPAYGTNCILSVVAFASSSKILLVRLTKGKGKAKRIHGQGRALFEEILLSASRPKFAFQMDVLAASLYHDFGLRVRSGVDLLSVSQKHDRRSLAALMESIGGERELNKPNVAALFKGGENFSKTTLKEIALQAWVAWRAASLDNMTALLNNVPRIDTSAFEETHLSAFAKMVRDASRLSALKPTSVKNEIAQDYSYKKGRLHVTCTRFKNHIRSGDPRTIEVQITDKGQRTKISCATTSVDGRAVKMNLDKPLPPGSIRLTTVGREPLTTAEKQCVDIILTALQGTSAIADKPFFQAIWLPQVIPSWPPARPSTRPVAIHFSRALNDSQKMAVAAIVSAKPLNVIHGPPGTGKTTVIAAAVTSISASQDTGKTMWLVAQSNVAVKNIAEKLASVDFLDFKLVVSRDFHYDWHEHLYEKINPNLIRSDLLTDDLVATERLLLGSKVILCTLSMLSNSRISTIARLVPLQTVIVDEASQVEISSYLPMISLFSHSVRKLVFIGDDKQLPPYGQSDVPSLQSVFEMEHLRKGAIFLNTQCMMPTQLGTFIGKHVYDNKLQTVHRNTSQCCRFIDVKKSKEVQKGSSWINYAEVFAAICEARKCVKKQRSYRIITPYDAQRGKIEDALKSEKIPWEDKVFCVDSFQGNEDEYIILSIVRTEKIGFLAEQRRMGMTICTSRAFVEGTAKDTLVGRLASSIGERAWEG
ncbi:P-loop containing nucleoside triphosphate hydrolase protein [Mycena capillaripes]|nr:P-loop containing nucleoside triphosphate hydrolase protein [Mycena capillaripes]